MHGASKDGVRLTDDINHNWKRNWSNHRRYSSQLGGACTQMYVLVLYVYACYATPYIYATYMLWMLHESTEYFILLDATWPAPTPRYAPPSEVESKSGYACLLEESAPICFVYTCVTQSGWTVELPTSCGWNKVDRGFGVMETSPPS